MQKQPHPTDRRSKLLTITETGRQVLFGVFGRMEQASQLVAGDLPLPERAQLRQLLQKLDAFHQPIYAARPAGFQKLLSWLPAGPRATGVGALAKGLVRMLRESIPLILAWFRHSNPRC